MTRRLRSALIAAALFCVLIVPLSSAQGFGSTELPAWGTEPSPNAGFPRNVFSAVDALSPTDAWAVGHFEQNGDLHPRPLVERWDGNAWSSVAVPWREEGELLGVAAVAPGDVWMVGGYQAGGSALIAHWDGTALSVVPHPSPGGFNRLFAVAAIAPDDVWAVGEYSNEISRTLALHWNGSTWTHVPTPSGEGYNRLFGVTALASDDVWAVGDDGNSTLSLHWDGSSWTRVPTPSPGSAPKLRAVSASLDGEVWAVGDDGPDAITMRWDGSKWNLVPSPNPSLGHLDLNGVVSLSATDAWAVGVYDVRGDWRNLTMHWDGSSWTQVQAPSPDPIINVLYGITALSSSELWAVGYGGGTGTLALRLQGAEWQPTTTANEGTGENVLNGISARNSSDIWAVGHAQNRSLTMHFDGSAWSVVPSPNLEYGVRLEDVATVGQTDAWAVGWSGSAASLDDKSVAVHWDGKAWTIVPTPQPGGELIDRLLAVDAASSTEVWATGVYRDENDPLRDLSLILRWDGARWNIVPQTCNTYWGLTGLTVLSATDVWAVGNALTCHYDGSGWTEMASPQPRGEYYEIAYPLEDLSGTSSNDVWAVGARIIDSPWDVLDWRSIAEHWDGTEWRLVTFVPGQLMRGVEALSATNVWAVGNDDYGPLIVHFDGSSWTAVPTPEWGRGGRLAGIDSAANELAASPIEPRELWSAGNYFPGGVPSRTLVQRAPSPTQGAVFGDTNVSFATVSWFGPENGSTETNYLGEYEIGGLTAGTYTFIATNPGCTPALATVTVLAGKTLRQDFQIGCSRAHARRAGRAAR
jgi:Carboxypeptidase regulatory-like domain